MKRLFLSIIACLLAAVSINALDAKSVLDKASANFKKCPSVTIGYTVSNGDDSDKGTITLQGQKFCNKMSNMTVWFDGKTMWSYNKDNEEVNVTTPSASQVAKMNPYAFLSIYRKGYKVAFGKNTNQYYEVILTAQDAKTSVQKLTVRINRSNYQPVYVVMTSKKTGNMTIDINSYKKGKRQSDAAYQFSKTKYPNVEVIDLR